MFCWCFFPVCEFQATVVLCCSAGSVRRHVCRRRRLRQQRVHFRSAVRLHGDQRLPRNGVLQRRNQLLSTYVACSVVSRLAHLNIRSSLWWALHFGEGMSQRLLLWGCLWLPNKQRLRCRLHLVRMLMLFYCCVGLSGMFHSRPLTVMPSTTPAHAKAVAAPGCSATALPANAHVSVAAWCEFGWSWLFSATDGGRFGSACSAGIQ